MLKLFWVTTEDHCEDWFIIAGREKEAAELHQNLEGYDTGEATAEWILDIPEALQLKKGGHRKRY